MSYGFLSKIIGLRCSYKVLLILTNEVNLFNLPIRSPQLSGMNVHVRRFV